MKRVNHREAFIVLNNSPWWDDKKRYYGSFYSEVKASHEAFDSLTLEELSNKLSFHFFPDQDNLNVLATNANKKQGEELVSALKLEKFYIELIELGQDGVNQLESIFKPNNSTVHHFFYSEYNKLEKAGIGTIEKLALLPAEVVANSTGIPLSRVEKMRSMSMLLQAGIPYAAVEKLIYPGKINCIQDFIDADPQVIKERFKYVQFDYTLAELKSWQKNARFVGIILLLKGLLNYSTDQIVRLIHHLSPERLAAQFFLLANSFNHPDIKEFKQLLKQFFEGDIFTNRHDLLSFLKEIAEQPSKLDKLRNNLSVGFKRLTDASDQLQSISTIIDLDEESEGKLNNEGIYLLCDLRIIDLQFISERTDISFEKLNRWQNMAALMAYNVVEPEYAYVIEDSGHSEQALRFFNYYHESSYYRMRYPIEFDERWKFEYKGYKEQRSPIDLHFWKLWEEKIIHETKFKMHDYFTYKSNATIAGISHLRIGICAPGNYKYYLSHLLNNHCLDLVCRPISIPMNNCSIEEMKEKNVCIVLDFSFGDLEVRVPAKQNHYLDKYYNFHRAMFDFGRELAKKLKLTVVEDNSPIWNEMVENSKDNFGARLLQISLPKNAQQNQIVEVLKAFEEALWEQQGFQPGHLSGQVIDENGYPVSGVKVTLSSQRLMWGVYFHRDRKYATQTTNSSGKYSFKVAHQEAYYGNDTRGATLELFKHGLLIEQGHRKILFGKSPELELIHHTKIVNHF